MVHVVGERKNICQGEPQELLAINQAQILVGSEGIDEELAFIDLKDEFAVAASGSETIHTDKVRALAAPSTEVVGRRRNVTHPAYCHILLHGLEPDLSRPPQPRMTPTHPDRAAAGWTRDPWVEGSREGCLYGSVFARTTTRAGQRVPGSAGPPGLIW